MKHLRSLIKPLTKIQNKHFYFIKILINLNYTENGNIKPIFVTQENKIYGISTHRLYLINKETKEFCKLNDYKLVKLDEIYIPDYNDYFDNIHTTQRDL